MAYAVGYGNAAAITTTGDLYTWGDNSAGHIGNGTVVRRDAPFKVGASIPKMRAVATTSYTTLAVSQTGELWTWGGYQLLGAASPNLNDNVPKRVALPSGMGPVKDIQGVYSHVVALTEAGELWAWGDNVGGAVTGTGGGAAEIRVPTKVATPAGLKFVKVAVSPFYAVAKDTTGKFWSWGVLQGSFHEITVPAGVIDVDTGYYFQLYRTRSDTVYGIGSNDNGQLGDGTTINRANPVLVNVPAAGVVSAGGSQALAVRSPAISNTPCARPGVIDADSDCISDIDETALGTNPNKADTDGDGLPDGWEVPPGTVGAGVRARRLGGTDAVTKDSAVPDNTVAAVNRDVVFGPYDSGSAANKTIYGNCELTQPLTASLRVVGGGWCNMAAPNPLVRDSYLELDYQDCERGSCPGDIAGKAFDDAHHSPNVDGISDVVDMFKRNGIQLHVTIDERITHDVNCDQAPSAQAGEFFGSAFQRRANPFIVTAKKAASDTEYQSTLQAKIRKYCRRRTVQTRAGTTSSSKDLEKSLLQRMTSDLRRVLLRGTLSWLP